ncbi:MAG TPA: hypothetical protein PKD64_01670 [Pirellulaceae bacterium]|nr:hypothetical protein [Pirellulaceae bacterium]HMO90878.1 hypothetical protein [Pirellulaceae bacterium]HMP68646.1 hypothetical protein [Pirellulaceae bacterium]
MKSAQLNDSKSADEIFKLMRQTYAQAEHYRDNATLHLQYRLDGGLLEEFHPWSVVYNRPNKLAAKIYNVRIKADATKLTTFVYDFPTENLDNQYLVMNATTRLPFNRLLTDSIARYFLSGHNELPLNGSLAEASDALIPPTLHLLTGEPTSSWLANGTLSRLQDAIIDERHFYRLEFANHTLKFVATIDPQTFLLRHIEFPVELLDDELLKSQQISELRLYAKLEDAHLTPEDLSTQESFEQNIASRGQPVSRFVAVPEKFPCDWIGQSLSSLQFHDLGGSDFKANQLRGQICALFWMDNESLAENIPSLLDFASSIDRTSCRLVVVLVGDVTDNRPLAQLMAQEFEAISDRYFQVGSRIGLQVTPSVVLLDQNAVVQYVHAISQRESWSNVVSGALGRLRNGESLAQEMRDQYAMFLEQYRQRIHESNPSDETAHQASRAMNYFRFRERWRSSDLALPGNISKSHDGQSLLITDGFKTIAKLNLEGKLMSRHEITMPTHQAISIVRVNPMAEIEMAYATFTTLGTQVLILDHAFGAVAAVPASDEQWKIVDACWYNAASGKIPGLSLALYERNEIVHGILDGNPLSTIQLDVPAKSMAYVEDLSGQPRLVTSLQDGTLIVLAANRRNEGGTKSQVVDMADQLAGAVFSRSSQVHHASKPDSLAKAPSSTITSDTECVVLSLAPTGFWFANGFSKSLVRNWRIPVPPQLHQNQVNAIAHCETPLSKAGIWAVAGSDGRVAIISGDGRFADELETNLTINGIELVSFGAETILVVSSAGQVIAWSIHGEVSR